ncbi:MAG: HIT family protein [Acholeplasmatales bacterium]|nr:HIT family protein [Acholeplasmatales bacterium]
MKKDGCPYCQQGEFLAKFGKLAFETETSEIIVFKDQHHKGRAIVAYKKDHVAEIQDLSDEELRLFMADVKKTAKAIQKAYNPDRINYGAYGDTLGHLHIHLVPKYKDGFEWGGTFVMNTNEYVSDSEIDEVIKEIKKNF